MGLIRSLDSNLLYVLLWFYSVTYVDFSHFQVLFSAESSPPQ